MARSSDMKSLVERFAADLEAIVRRQAKDEFAARFDELRSDILEGATRAPSLRGRAAKGGRPGPRAGYAAAEKPCPVCGKMNKARRFSFLCEDHRTPENLAKFKGTSRQAGTEESEAPKAARAGGKRRGAGKAPKAAAARKGAGRGRKGGRGKAKGAAESAGAAQG